MEMPHGRRSLLFNCRRPQRGKETRRIDGEERPGTEVQAAARLEDLRRDVSAERDTAPRRVLEVAPTVLRVPRRGADGDPDPLQERDLALDRVAGECRMVARPAGVAVRSRDDERD